MEDDKRVIVSICFNTILRQTEEDQEDILYVKAVIDDSDEELDEEVAAILKPFIEKIPRISVPRFFEDIVPTFTQRQFLQHFRISRDLFHELSTKYGNTDAYKKISMQHLVLSPQKTLAIFLWFCGNEGETYREISNFFNVSINTVHRVIRRIIVFLSCMVKQVVRWPSLEEMKEEADYHKYLTKMPGVIGAIDGTRVEISPPSEDKDEYIDRKGNTTIAVQGVCNRYRKFISITIGFPGSVHDARVYNCSEVPGLLESCPPGFYLLGDSAYPCKPHLLVPYRDTGRLTSAQKKFNRVLSSSRVQIEHTFGILKQRFRQLYGCKLRGMHTICHFIRACMILHNISKEEEIAFLNENTSEILNTDEDDDPMDIENNVNSGEDSGSTVRESVCQYLANLQN